MKIEIFIATQKNLSFPNSSLYIPIHVGKALDEQRLNLLSDNTFDNISLLNKSFCELTALYWIWKNCNAEILGLIHYRRYLSGNSLKFGNRFILDRNEILDILSKKDIIIPKKYLFRKYLILPLTVKNHYYKDHYRKDWEILRETVENLYPDYIRSFNYIENKYSIHLCNIFIARKELIDNYCDWLFSILFEAQKRIDVSTYDTYQARVFGFLSERLFNIYIHHHKFKICTKDMICI